MRALAALHIIQDVKLPPARLLTQSRLRDGAFDIGMFRSYWERAARLAGSATNGVTSLRTPNADPGTEGSGSEARPGGMVGDSPADSESVAGPRQALSGLIHRAMESADELASSTRRVRTGSALTPRGAPTGDSPTG